VCRRQGVRHRFRYVNSGPPNDTNFDLKGNCLEYRGHAPDGTVTCFSRVTDSPVYDSNLMTLMRGARADWKIENETFNTLENQGHHFAHQHRSRPSAPRHRAHPPDDPGISDRSHPTMRLPNVPGRSNGGAGKTRLSRQLRNRFDLSPGPRNWETLYRYII
jgi:hypothetical protein